MRRVVPEPDFWATPVDLFEAIDRSYGPFTLDACATAANAKCPRFFSPLDDGLSQSWAGERVWLNPPYGPGVSRWLEKASRESGHNGATVVALLPVRTDVAWWHRWVAGREWRPIRGRVRFGKARYDAMFPSALVVYRPALVAGRRELNDAQLAIEGVASC